MLYTVNQLYTQLCFKTVSEVYEIFKNFFGEEYVDLQPSFNEDLFKLKLLNTLKDLGIEISNTIDYNIPYELSDDVLFNFKQRIKCFADFKVSIYVWWPSVIVTNEHNRSVHIRDLYAKVNVQMDGRIPYENAGFLLNRATYTKEQFLSNYMHSHINGIPKGRPEAFMAPCLGRGPIVDTIGTLKNTCEETTWMLFCQELSMYVTVESLEGGPWKRLEEIGSHIELSAYNGHDSYSSIAQFTSKFSSEQLKEFIKYYLEEGHLSLSFREGTFCCGMPYYEYIIDISNAFIDYYNKHLKTNRRQAINLYSYNSFDTNLLSNVIAANGKFYNPVKRDSYREEENLDRYRNKFVLNFKGKPVFTTITDDETSFSDKTLTTVLNSSVAMYILQHILRTINYKYRNEYYYNKYDHLKNAPSYKRVIYV